MEKRNRRETLLFFDESVGRRKKQLLYRRIRVATRAGRRTARAIENESADADVLLNAREAKTNNAKANILANFGGGDLSSRLVGILMRRRVASSRSTTYSLPDFSLSSPLRVALIEDAPREFEKISKVVSQGCD